MKTKGPGEIGGWLGNKMGYALRASILRDQGKGAVTQQEGMHVTRGIVF